MIVFCGVEMLDKKLISECLCLFCQYKLLPLCLGLALPSPGMFSSPLLFNPSRLQHGSLKFRGLIYRFWYMPTPCHLPNLGIRLPPLLKTVTIFHCCTFSGVDDPKLIGRARFPYTHIAVLRAGKHESRVSRKNRRGYPLHSFRVIHLRLRALSLLPYSHRAIPTSADEFQTGGTPIAASDGSDVGFVYMSWGGKTSDVERVEIMVF